MNHSNCFNLIFQSLRREILFQITFERPLNVLLLMLLVLRKMQDLGNQVETGNRELKGQKFQISNRTVEIQSSLVNKAPDTGCF